MDNRLYLSVLTTAASSGDIDFTLQTFGSTSDSTITGSVTGVATSDSEKDIAVKLYDQLGTIIIQNSASYIGTPEAIPNPPPPTFQLTRTDHCVCVWSQAQFDLELTDNTGTIISLRSTPTLLTVSEAQTLGAVMRQTFPGFTTAQIATLLDVLSDEIISTTRNNFVASTYSISMNTDKIDGVRLPKYPVLDMDTPKTSRPFLILNIADTTVIDESSRYYIQRDGWVMYKYSQDLVHVWNEPFDMNNQWMVTWIAGYQRIPDKVKMAMVKLSPLYTNYSIYEELAGGTSRVKYRNEASEKKRIYGELREYMI